MTTVTSNSGIEKLSVCDAMKEMVPLVLKGTFVYWDKMSVIFFFFKESIWTLYSKYNLLRTHCALFLYETVYLSCLGRTGEGTEG